MKLHVCKELFAIEKWLQAQHFLCALYAFHFFFFMIIFHLFEMASYLLEHLHTQSIFITLYRPANCIKNTKLTRESLKIYHILIMTANMCECVCSVLCCGGILGGVSEHLRYWTYSISSVCSLLVVSSRANKRRKKKFAKMCVSSLTRFMSHTMTCVIRNDRKKKSFGIRYTEHKMTEKMKPHEITIPITPTDQINIGFAFESVTGWLIPSTPMIHSIWLLLGLAIYSHRLISWELRRKREAIQNVCNYHSVRCISFFSTFMLAVSHFQLNFNAEPLQCIKKKSFVNAAIVCVCMGMSI